jgi:hypothetical protein
LVEADVSEKDIALIPRVVNKNGVCYGTEIFNFKAYAGLIQGVWVLPVV